MRVVDAIREQFDGIVGREPTDDEIYEINDMRNEVKDMFPDDRIEPIIRSILWYHGCKCQGMKRCTAHPRKRKA